VPLPGRGLVRDARDYGVRDAITMALATRALHVLPTALRPLIHPPLEDLARQARAVHLSATDLAVRHLDGGNADLVAAFEAEHHDVRATVERRYDDADLTHPPAWAVDEETSLLLYLLVRLLRPARVLETGVANGHSASFVLAALAANGHGELHSVDVQPEVGTLLTERDRRRWHLHVLDPDARKASFYRALDAVGTVDVFVHDSNHRYPWQRFEYAAVRDRLADGAVLASDDVDASYAFIDLCDELGRQPVLLVGRRKVFGLVLPEQS
jgi:hypothetical protein